MEFMYIDSSEAKEEELIEVLDNNKRTASLKREEIKRLKNAASSSIIEIKEAPKVVFDSISSSKSDDIDYEFEEEIDYYMSKFNEVHDGDDISEILPVRKNYNYKKIVFRMIAELNKDIKDIYEIIISEGDMMSFSELSEYKVELTELKNKIALLKEALIEKKDMMSVEEHKNKMIFVPTSSGNIRALDELKSMPKEYYEGFLELFKSIEDGTFKRIKRFVNSNILNGALEVKGFKVRVLFVQLEKDYYAIISAFVKKSDNDKGYRMQIENKYTEYKKMADTLKSQLKNSEFLEMNAMYQEELFRLLGVNEDEKGAIK